MRSLPKIEQFSLLRIMLQNICYFDSAITSVSEILVLFRFVSPFSLPSRSHSLSLFHLLVSRVIDIFHSH